MTDSAALREGSETNAAADWTDYGLDAALGSWNLGTGPVGLTVSGKCVTERYDVLTGKWATAPQLARARSACAV